MVYYDKERGRWIGADERLRHQVVVAHTKEQAERDLALVVAVMTLGADIKRNGNL